MKKQYLECGKIVTTHGVLGEIKAQPWMDSPEELASLPRIYLAPGEAPLRVLAARVHKDMVLLRLEGVDTMDAAQALRGKILWMNREDLELAEGEYFIQDLIGMEVFDADSGECYGSLLDVTETGANDVYHITFADGTVRLIPVIPEVVISTDVDAGRMTIRPLAGLFDDED